MTKPDQAPSASTPVHYQMWWDCPTCGTTALLGQTHRHCPHCGAAQEPERRYFPPVGQEIEVQHHRYVGVDWCCTFCDSPNAASAAFCGNCGGPKDGAKTVKLVHDTPTPTSPVQSSPPKRTWAYYLWGMLLLLGVVLFYFAFRTHTESVMVVDKNWTREIQIERFTAVNQTSWCDAMPNDAYQVSRSKVQRSTRSIADGQTCHEIRVDAGDGTFTKRQECSPRYRQEPVYDDQCRYRVNRWQLQRTDKLQGLVSQAPIWPKPVLAQGMTGMDGLGTERLGQRHETYRVVLQAAVSKRQWTCEVSAVVWSGLRIAQGVPLKVRGTGGADCSSLSIQTL